MEQHGPGYDVAVSYHVEKDIVTTDGTSEVLSQSKGTDMPVLLSKKRGAKRLKVSKKGKKSTSIIQGQSKAGHVEEGTEHMFRTHICSECRRCFKSRSHLMEHMRLHFPDPTLQCPTCKRYFTSKSKLRVHMLRETGQKLHRCHICQYGAVERNSLRRHLASVHGHQADDSHNEDLFTCPICQKKFSQSQALKSHMKSHNNMQKGQPLFCFYTGCSFQCTEKKKLQKHMLEAHGIEAVGCHHHSCGAVFGSREEMEKHYRTHQAYHCSHCDFSCSNKSRFLQHKRQGHPGKLELNCSFCTFSTLNPVEYDQHIGHFHANEKTHRCPQCSFLTAHKRVLKRHMLMHTGEKPHKCTLCDFRCRDETYLSKHMLTHSNDKQHMCSECGYVTKWKHYLSVHMRKHTGDLRYKCNQCPYRCHRIDQLNSHKLRHQEKSLICEICAYSCKRKTELRRHMQLKHSTHAEIQPPVYQCKFCSYSTKHRQALHSHENCRHTRTRMFSCALCRYTTFSNTGLFLHKKKMHGYVPGDVGWLERYKEKENERNSTDLAQNFFTKTSTQTGDLECREQTINRKKTNISFNNKNNNNNEDEAVTATTEEHPSPTDEEQNCSTIFTSQTSTGSTQFTLLSAETASVGNTTCDVSHALNVTHQNSPEPAAENNNDDTAYFDEQSESENLPTVTQTENKRQEPENSEVCQSEIPTFDSSAEPSASETCLQLMRRQDKDQAKALVLEGKVQMLVVQTQDNMYRCSHCTYVTRKQAALIRHTRSSCHVIKAALRCQDCGMKFKQQRSLKTHRLRKCRSLQMGKKTFADTLSHSKAGTRTTVKSNAGCLTKQPEISEVIRAEHHEISGYIEDDSRYTCKVCRFSSVRKVTIDRHCATCAGKAHKKDLSEFRKEFELKDNSSESDYIPENNVEDLSERDSADEETPQDPETRFSCSNCPFVCHQKRTLSSHEIKGCLKPGELQCPHCSFVSKSERSLKHHIQGHRKDKHATREKTPGKLRCELCSFTCKQERCLKQHVAVKHDGVRPHQCRFCSFSTTRRYRLDAHESMHTGVGRHCCELCGQTFGTTSRLRLHHQRIHDKQPTHFCSFCDYKAYNINDISRHNLSCHTGDLSHHCSLCDARFSSDIALKQHRNRAHPDTNSLSCAHCSFTCNGQTDLKAHLQRDHSDIRNSATAEDSGPGKQNKSSIACQCLVCSFSTHKRLLLIQHMLDEHEDGPAAEKTHKCDVCGFSCAHQVVFDQHVRSHGGTCLYKCTECEFSTRNKQKITWHIRTHTGEKPYRCEKCNYACADPSRLKYHMRIHMEERKYLCPECGYKCKWINQLKYHMTKHTGAKPYSCEDCDYRTNRADSLRIHRETRHRDMRSFICEKCGNAFKTRFLLRNHQRKHSEDRPYVCSVCQRTFRWPAGLRHHYLSHTNQLPFHCLHCPYRAKQKFQVVKHLRRHHPDLPVQDGVGKDQEASSITQKSWLRDKERQEGQASFGDMETTGDI